MAREALSNGQKRLKLARAMQEIRAWAKGPCKLQDSSSSSRSTAEAAAPTMTCLEVGAIGLGLPVQATQGSWGRRHWDEGGPQCTSPAAQAP